MKEAVAGSLVGLIRGPMGGLIGGSIGCSAWQIRALAEAQGSGTIPWLILALLFLISVAAPPAIAHYGLTARRWSGLKTVVAYAACLVAGNALFVAAGYMLVGEGLVEVRLYIPVLAVAAAVLAFLFLFPTFRTRMARNLEEWRDAQR